jgi:hypothetical protein
MTKVIQVKMKPFGVPSVEVDRRIDNSDTIAALNAAGYRYTARLRELENQFEAKASELRQAYLDEVAAAQATE